MSALHSQGLEQEGKVVTGHCPGNAGKGSRTEAGSHPAPTGVSKRHPKGDRLRTTPKGEDRPGQGRLVPSTKTSSGLTSTPQSAGSRPRPAVNQGPEGARQLCIVRWGVGVPCTGDWQLYKLLL